METILEQVGIQLLIFVVCVYYRNASFDPARCRRYSRKG